MRLDLIRSYGIHAFAQFRIGAATNGSYKRCGRQCHARRPWRGPEGFGRHPWLQGGRARAFLGLGTGSEYPAHRPYPCSHSFQTYALRPFAAHYGHPCPSFASQRWFMARRGGCIAARYMPGSYPYCFWASRPYNQRMKCSRCGSLAPHRTFVCGGCGSFFGVPREPSRSYFIAALAILAIPALVVVAAFAIVHEHLTGRRSGH